MLSKKTALIQHVEKTRERGGGTCIPSRELDAAGVSGNMQGKGKGKGKGKVREGKVR